jgi:SAM-dependent methyltransferase
VVATWHYGLVARWWAEFNREGPEIESYRPFVEVGQPALDAGCGTGRLLLPYLRDGLDVDGCDVSPDMLAECRRLASAEGLEPTLHTQALHELDLPRRYRTIVCCGTFGLGSTRGQDEDALRGRVVAVDRCERQITRAIQAWQWRDGELVAEEEHLLTESAYERDELAALLREAGFADVEARDGASAWGHDMLVFLARRPQTV